MVLSWARQRLHAIKGMSLMGDGMLVRLRSASIALFGLATVVGLGLIVFIAQLGFPGVFISPIPGDSSKVGSVDEAIALVQSGGVDSPERLRGGRRSPTAHQAPRREYSPVDAGLGGSRSLAASPAPQPSPAVAPPPPSPDPAPGPAGQPATPAPVSPSPTPAPDSTTVSVPKSSSESQSKTTSSSKSKSKSKSKTSKSVSSKTTSEKGGKSGSHYTPSSKSNDDSSDKAEEDQIAPPSKTTVPAPVEPKSKQVPEVPEKGVDKESADSGKSDKYRH